MNGSQQRSLSSLLSFDPLPYFALLWLGTLCGLFRGLWWAAPALGGLALMFVAVLRARSVPSAVLCAVAFGAGEAGVCFFGSVSWGGQVPLVLAVLCVLTHHLPLSLWARWSTGALRGHWLWIGSIGFSASSNALAELLGIPSREAVVLVSSFPQLVTGARLFGADIITGIIETTLLMTAFAVVRCDGEDANRQRLAQGLRSLLLGVSLLAGSAALARSTSGGSLATLRVGIPQINADSSYYKSRLLIPELTRGFDQQFDALTESLADADLVVTTEGFDGGFGLMLPDVREAWAKRARDRGQSLLMTSYVIKPDGRKSNAAGAFSSDGRFIGMHEKVDLAPFGERDLAPGREFRPLAVGGPLKLGVLICQESYLQRGAKSLARAGATLLATTTSDITFGSSTTVLEHLAMAELRAIESGRDMVWASNAGPSGVIDRFGSFQPGPFRMAAAVPATASLYSDLTPFDRYATLWLWCGPALLVIGAGTARRGARATRRITTTLPRRRWLRIVLALSSAAAAVGTALGTSAAVEARWGKPTRAWAAIPDLLYAPPALSAPNAFARFARREGRSAEGALAYLLEYYGLRSDESRALATLPMSPSLVEVSELLQSRYGLASRRVPLTGPLPLTPLLLRSHEGHFAVVDYAGSGHGGLVDFVSCQSRSISAKELAELQNVEGLFPFAQP